jgi:hypothetical protein
MALDDIKIVRVLRIIEYTGPRHVVTTTIAQSIDGMFDAPNGMRIVAALVASGTPDEIAAALRYGIGADARRALMNARERTWVNPRKYKKGY